MAARADDYTLDDDKQRLIRKHAELALKKAGGLGRFPTPIADVLEAAKVVVCDEPALDHSFLAKLRKQAGLALKSAISKIWGIVDTVAKIIYLDKTVHVVKQKFLQLHETAHAVLPWQREIFVVAEDCELTLDPEIADLFEREANNFASEVYFQLDGFSDIANQSAVNITVPLQLSKKFGASIYASIRRYVTRSPRACMVLVLEPPQVCNRRGFVAKLRRHVVSPDFRRVMGELSWPDEFGPDDQVGALVPVGERKMSRPREIALRASDGTRHKCLAEAFRHKYNVFVLIHSITTLKRGIVV